jgi:hypothetical protein
MKQRNLVSGVLVCAGNYMKSILKYFSSSGRDTPCALNSIKNKMRREMAQFMTMIQQSGLIFSAAAREDSCAAPRLPEDERKDRAAP